MIYNVIIKNVTDNGLEINFFFSVCKQCIHEKNDMLSIIIAMLQLQISLHQKQKQKNKTKKRKKDEQKKKIKQTQPQPQPPENMALNVFC
jgi:protein subunit release factor B